MVLRSAVTIGGESHEVVLIESYTRLEGSWDVETRITDKVTAAGSTFNPK